MMILDNLYSKKSYQCIRNMMLVMLIVLCIVIVTKNVQAETFFVTNSEMFENALKESSVNQEHDTIKIAEGVQIPDTAPYSEIGFSLTLEAGYSEDFSSRRWRRTVPEEPLINGGIDSDTPQQSTTGPYPPEGVDTVSPTGQVFTGEQGGIQKTIGVPAYSWRHGCGPTALGMVLGYYDVSGFSDLFDGSAVTQTASVNQGIASERSTSDPGHYEDYSQPIDDGQPIPLPDRSEPPSGDEHTSDSIADFMKTSFSSEANFYGWSRSSDMSRAFFDYVALRNSTYTRGAAEYDKLNGTLSWAGLTSRIDNNQPMVFLVDTDADGNTDHFVTVVGYRDDTIQQYGCLDTWPPFSTVRWCDFANMSSGQPWGISKGWLFTVSMPNSPDLEVINPSVNDSALTPGQSFTIYATVKNQGTGSSLSTTLRWYRSTDSTITTSDTQIGTDPVVSLGVGGTSPKNITVSAPTADGTYYVGACVDTVSGESNIGNQCSNGVQITVSTPTAPGLTPIYLLLLNSQ